MKKSNLLIYLILCLSLISNFYCYILIHRIYGTLNNRKVEINILNEKLSEIEYNIENINNKVVIKNLGNSYNGDIENKLRNIEMQSHEDINRLRKDVEFNRFGEHLRTRALEDKLNSYETDNNGYLHHTNF